MSTAEEVEAAAQQFNGYVSTSCSMYLNLDLIMRSLSLWPCYFDNMACYSYLFVQLKEKKLTTSLILLCTFPGVSTPNYYF